MLDTILAYQFWRMGKISMFAVPLYLIAIADVVFVVFAQAVELSNFALMFILNRIFELTLLYLIGCSLFRLHVLRLQKKSQEPIAGWRARFVVG